MGGLGGWWSCPAVWSERFDTSIISSLPRFYIWIENLGGALYLCGKNWFFCQRKSRYLKYSSASRSCRYNLKSIGFLTKLYTFSNACTKSSMYKWFHHFFHSEFPLGFILWVHLVWHCWWRGFIFWIGLYIFFGGGATCWGHDFMRFVCRSSRFEGRPRLPSLTQAVSRFTPNNFCSAFVCHISNIIWVANLISVSHDFWLFQFIHRSLCRHIDFLALFGTITRLNL